MMNCDKDHQWIRVAELDPDVGAFGENIVRWCTACGALDIYNHIRNPSGYSDMLALMDGIEKKLDDAIVGVDTMVETLTRCQEECTRLLEENRQLKAQLS